MTGCPNLYLVTSHKRRRQRWIFRYSRPDGSGVTERRVGRYPEVTIEIAKATADRLRTFLARERKDPYKEDWSEGGAGITFEKVATEWLDISFPVPSKQRREAKYMLFNHAKELLEKPIIKIQAKHVADALRPMCERMPKRVRRVLRRVEAVFELAKLHREYFGDNPAHWKGRQEILFRGMLKTSRDHFAAMPYEDLPEFIRTLRQRQDSSVAAVALEFLILTAARTDEVRGMPLRGEIDWENKVWTIPAERMKAERDHQVPLCDRAIELLKRRKEHAVGQYVFSAHQRNKPLDEKAMLNILHKIAPGYTVHGLRSSFSDWANDKTDYGWDTIEECLAHKVGNDVRRAYRRREGLEKRREIMEAWAAYIG